MVKKIVLGLLMVAFSGVLVAGALMRTNAKNDSAGSGEARASEAGQTMSDGNGRGSANRNEQDPGAQGQRYRGGQGAARDTAAQAGAGARQNGGQAEQHDWLVVTGSVATSDGTQLVLVQSDGTQVVIEGRAWRYAQEQGFATQVGDIVTLTGFYESADVFSAAVIADETSGQSVTVRDESGRPLWAGQGGRGGNRDA